MYITVKYKKLIVFCVILVMAVTSAIGISYKSEITPVSSSKSYIKWVDYSVSLSAMKNTYQLDVDSYGKKYHYNWIELLAYLAAKYGGNFKYYKSKDLDALIEKLDAGENMSDITKDMKYYSFYKKAYTAVLGGFLGEYYEKVDDGNGSTKLVKKYGLVVYSPIASGYSYSHSDDFGNGRTFGYKRKHLGNDLMGSVGTPIVAVESGFIEVMGWNRYGGWRIGIRSADNKRSYYYAHLRKNWPYNKSLKEGDYVEAGTVIGYLGMTGYSYKENTNNINVPHLHFGMQLIFDESQKEGVNQIWIDVYNIVNFLSKHRSVVYKDSKTGDYYAKNSISIIDDE